MNLIFFDNNSWENLLPLTFTKPAAELRVGILKIREKWEKHLTLKGSFLTPEYLQPSYPVILDEINLLINGTLLPTENLTEAIMELRAGESLKKNHHLLAFKTNTTVFNLNDNNLLEKAKEYTGPVNLINYPWKIFGLNGQEVENDFTLITNGRKSAQLNESVRVLQRDNIFVEEGFRGAHFILNASSGPVYLGKNSEIMEGAVIRGPFALCENATVKLGAKIYGPTTIGPYCKVGGEINNSILQAYSNKGHDGFLGNSVVGEWCNLGADTNNSNLKNNYADVSIWNYTKEGFINTGLQFCGMFMGDHSKSSINTMFNTGTVIGVSANIFGTGFPRNFIPSFSWGGHEDNTVYKLEKALETMNLVMSRRGKKLSEKEVHIYRHIYNNTAKYRRY